jgi:MoaA/NifB/PqqE/SkfB family radical SAM enzyme
MNTTRAIVADPRIRGKRYREPDETLAIDAFDFLWLEITPRCNLACTHCYAESSPLRTLHGEMSFEQWQHLIADAAALGCENVQFIGGEPTMHPRLPELIAYARDVRVKTVEVFTNGTVLPRRLRTCFLEHRVDLAFSVYSSEASIHDAVTQRSGSFEKTIASIRWALAVGLRVRAAMVAMEGNCADVERTELLLRSLGVTTIGQDRIRGVGRGLAEVGLSDPIDEMCGSCGRGQLAVAADGVVYPCVFSHFCPLGRATEGLAALLRSPALRDFRSMVREKRMRGSRTTTWASIDPPCDPETPPTPCDPDTPPTPCDPETPPTPCDPDTPPTPCDPETPPTPCDPETPPTPCDPEAPPP